MTEASSARRRGGVDVAVPMRRQRMDGGGAMEYQLWIGRWRATENPVSVLFEISTDGGGGAFIAPLPKYVSWQPPAKTSQTSGTSSL